MNALDIIDVSKSYKTLVLNDINFNIKQGEFVGLLGVNGAGKTTLISSIASINTFVGTIKIMGHDIRTSSVLAKQCLGVVPQEIAFDPFLTVLQTLEFQSGIYGIKNNRDWLIEILESIHLIDKLNANTRTLSGGMKRRLMFAQALVHKPKLIILDEPTAGVDVEIRQQLWKFIKLLHKLGHTILLTTHYLHEIEELCDRVLIIDTGKIIADLSKEDLLKHASVESILEIKTADIIPQEILNLNPSINETIYSFKLNNINEVTSVLKLMEIHNINILDINVKKQNLEDMFLSYIQKKTQ